FADLARGQLVKGGCHGLPQATWHRYVALVPELLELPDLALRGGTEEARLWRALQRVPFEGGERALLEAASQSARSRVLTRGGEPSLFLLHSPPQSARVNDNSTSEKTPARTGVASTPGLIGPARADLGPYALLRSS